MIIDGAFAKIRYLPSPKNRKELEAHYKSEIVPRIRSGEYPFGKCIFSFATYFQTVCNVDPGRANILAAALANILER